MELASILLINLASIAGCCFLLWLLSLRRRDVSIIDLFWGTGFVLVAWLTWILTDNASTNSLVLAIMTTLWGVRLSAYLAWRNHGKPEDHRYAAMREQHGEAFATRSLFTVFLLQAGILWFVSLPLQVGIQASGPWRPWHYAGLLFWAVGLLFESVGDYQLARFKSDKANRGKVLDTGLWHYTRHPNYFGDFLIWWGLYVTSLPAGYWTILSPILMSVLLMRVSGVRLLESSLRTRVSGYEDYVSRTSAFFPLPKKPLPQE